MQQTRQLAGNPDALLRDIPADTERVSTCRSGKFSVANKLQIQNTVKPHIGDGAFVIAGCEGHHAAPECASARRAAIKASMTKGQG
jgi:hypothetical protein